MEKRRTAITRIVLAVAALAGPALFASTGPVSADTRFPETGMSIWGPFEQYWKDHGGLAQFGFPRTSVFPAKEGNNIYDAQYFERALFTYNPSNPDPFKVQLQLLGNIITQNRRSEAPFLRKPAGSTPGGMYFEPTAHNLIGKFLEYWRSNGGLPIYGYPISEAFMEKSKSDGKEYLVQYFERNRLELHPELAGTQYEVQLGLLGSELLDMQGGPSAFANLGNPHFYPPSSGGGSGSTYPKTGHAPDYSWVAGQVLVTRIQGGCTFITTDTERFSPNGQGWQDMSGQLKNGDYVVIFGHIRKPGEPFEICPGGQPYIVDRVILNP